MNSILSSTLYNNYNNYSSPIPDNFDWKLYAAIVKDPTINSSSSAYKHYKHKCTVNSHNYRLYWRTYYKIPNNFVEESYKKYLNFSSIKFQFNNFEDLYKFYITKGIEMYPLNDQYSRIHFEIPDDFDAKIYITVYPEAKKENDNQIYHFYHYNKESFPLNAYYYRLKYNIPDDFDISVYNQRYNFNYNESNAYQFFKNIGKVSYPLDSKYYAIKYNIPDDFDIQVYNQRYNFNYNITNAYQFYKNIGQYSYPLDLEYYNLKNKTVFNRKYKNNIPNGNHFFDNQHHNTKIYTDNFNESNITILNSNDLDGNDWNDINLYGNNLASNNLASNNSDDNILTSNNLDGNILTSNNLDGNNLDSNLHDKNVRAILKIPQDFYYENYNLRYELNLNEIESYKYFNKNGKKHSLDEAYYRILYNSPSELTYKYLDSYKKLYPNTIKNNASIQDVFIYYHETIQKLKKEYLDSKEFKNNMEKYYHIFELIDPEVIFKENVFFYDFINSNIKLIDIYNLYLDYPDSEIGIKFIQNYEYLKNFENYICNEESRRFYFCIKDFINEYFNKPNLLINQKSYFSTTKTIQKTRTIKKQKIKEENDNNIAKIIPNLSRSVNLVDKIENNTDIIKFIDIMKKSSNPVYVEYDETEYYIEDETTFMDIKVPLYTTFYYNIENENKVYSYLDLYRKIQQSNSFYKLFIQKSQIINSFYNLNTSNNNDKYCVVVFLNDDYIHNYLSILNNLNYLGVISNLYLIVNDNVKNSEKFIYYTNLIQNKNIKVNLISISNNFTFNDYNNLLFDETFWEKFNSEFIILFSTLTFINSNFLNNNIIISNNFYVSNQLYNNYNMINTLFSIRSKKCILKLIDEQSNENELDLDYIPDDSSAYKLLNINKQFEKYKFIDYINQEIPIVYLEKMEKLFNYLDLEYNIMNILQFLR